MKKFIWPIYLIFLQKVDSTNHYIKRITLKYMKNWTIVWSINQINGKGVGKNHWDTEKGKNLTFSIFLKSIIFPINKGYIINFIISNAIHKTLFIYNQNIWIKWPNDIILLNKKIGGILIENNVLYKKIYAIIIGIGLNVNQIKFDKKFQASSLKKILKKNFQLEKLFYELIYFIQKECFLFMTYGEKFIRNYYINHLYMKDKISFFEIINNNYKHQKFTKGIIRNINKKGNLIIEFKNDNKLYSFSKKKIKLIF
ncbi:biotin--[acetyl-CoA-carboxylase] ligase [Blattabacterium punctulatus]|uniref:Biotin--[acetyl-CoA-carboxylase] ligase n=1 Tax=Blattabacterium punctulatus TaxID=164514 RepID=A0ABN5M296_9FLAO|nr:biotin--[acetyl-CoA-carboxylase] ligase [Blattabacterium punctulatus]AWU39774.1 biotin--[acetyl-CoA-carboxylase] ligase [Blattabacterium punctulatus]AWU40317.1 biotin--[acetyl-CoA-carboxylase] ligase [Blattabacterium punctulatus]